MPSVGICECMVVHASGSACLQCAMLLGPALRPCYPTNYYLVMTLQFSCQIQYMHVVHMQQPRSICLAIQPSGTGIFSLQQVVYYSYKLYIFIIHWTNITLIIIIRIFTRFFRLAPIRIIKTRTERGPGRPGTEATLVWFQDPSLFNRMREGECGYIGKGLGTRLRPGRPAGRECVDGYQLTQHRDDEDGYSSRWALSRGPAVDAVCLLDWE